MTPNATWYKPIARHNSRFVERDSREAASVLGKSTPPLIKSSFPTAEANRILRFLVTQGILRKWTSPIFNWPLILNRLALRFEVPLSF